jgi:hypothetical protein
MPDPRLLGNIDPDGMDALTLARNHAVRATQVLKALSDAGDKGEIVMIAHLDAYLRTAQAEAVTSRAWSAVAHGEALLTRPPTEPVPPDSK